MAEGAEPRDEVREEEDEVRGKGPKQHGVDGSSGVAGRNADGLGEKVGKVDVDVDEFGLPVRRFRRQAVEDSSEDDFEDAREEGGGGGSEVRGLNGGSGHEGGQGTGQEMGGREELKGHDDGVNTAGGVVLRAGAAAISEKDDQTRLEIGASKEEVDGVHSDHPSATSKAVDDHSHSTATLESAAPEETSTTMTNEKGKSTLLNDEAGDSQIPQKAIGHNRKASSINSFKYQREKMGLSAEPDGKRASTGISEWSHQLIVPQEEKAEGVKEEEEWQQMPAFAPYDLYNDDGKLVAREAPESDDEADAYAMLGGAGKGYTRVVMEEDAQSATSMDDDTKYLFKETGQNILEEDEDVRDPLAQMEFSKDLLTEGQRIAYVGITRLAAVDMVKELETMKGTRATRKEIQVAAEAMKMWSQKMMVRLYAHMEISSAEQIMIEQLAEHGVVPGDLTPTLMLNARVKNPMADDEKEKRSSTLSLPSSRPGSPSEDEKSPRNSISAPKQAESAEDVDTEDAAEPPPPYDETAEDELTEVQTPSQMPTTQNIDIDIRWTVLCDLFLVLIADSVYDSRSRILLERVGEHLDVPWLAICRFEKRVTDALEMQEAPNKENWNEDEHKENRRKMALKRRYMMMGLATVGGTLVIGLSAGLLAPVIGAGLAAGFTTIGVAGTSGFLAGAGGAALITSTAALSGGVIAVRASSRRTGAVQTFEYRPLHNKKRVNLILTVSGWMTGKVDDVRLPYSTVDPIMGDIYSLLWEPEMLQSMGQTINILATEALTQGLQQVLGSTILVTLMAGLQLPIVLSKLAYLIDNPWTVSLGRANAAGLILADSLIDRNLGSRPVTLVGYSLGSRVIFACLKELAARSAWGIVQNVYLFGSPIVAKHEEYLRARTVVSGRFVNGYASNDWILGYLFRATSGGIMRVSGLAKVEGIPGLENIDVTEFVPGHMAYRQSMPKLLRKVGWAVESDTFTEIEDPDPDNHQVRQRELIAELDEARKKEAEGTKKSRFGFLSMSKKKQANKKVWEMYDESRKDGVDGVGGESSTADDPNRNLLFDIDAIRRELASEMIEVKQLESTLPPMKLDLNSPPSRLSTERAVGPHDSLRQTKSFDEPATSKQLNGTVSSPAHPKIYTNAQTPTSNLPTTTTAIEGEEYTVSPVLGAEHRGSGVRLSFEPPPSSLSPTRASFAAREEEQLPDKFRPRDITPDVTPQRPGLLSAQTMPAAVPTTTTTTTKAKSAGGDVAGNGPALGLEHNAWAEDEDEFGREREVTMSFE